MITRIETVPAQEIEDLFSEPIGRDESRDEQTVLSHWKKFMSRNCLTETQYKNIVKDYSTLSNGLQPQNVVLNEENLINQNKAIYQRRKDYSKEVCNK